MNILKISYQKNWGEDGTVYSQTIKINNYIAKIFNEYIKNRIYLINEKQKIEHGLIESDMLELVFLNELKQGINYTQLTTLKYFISFYYKEFVLKNKKYEKSFKRILIRNTIIEVI